MIVRNLNSIPSIHQTETQWRQMREAIVLEGNLLKFKQNTRLLAALLSRWRGLNLLGKTLDRARQHLAFQIRMESGIKRLNKSRGLIF